MNLLNILAYITLCCFTVFFQLRADEDLVNIYGKIIDSETQLPVERAKIDIINSNKIVIFSNKNGEFQIDSLKKGDYIISVTASGYKPEYRKLKVKGSDKVEVAISLNPISYIYPSVVVSATPYNSIFQELIEESQVLSGIELQKAISQTLASTLKKQVGIAIRSMGPTPARPVIRGLSGNNVIIKYDGFFNDDLSATSADHAVTLDPLSANRIEIIRGPKILLNTSSTLGGLVNVINDGIPLNLPLKTDLNALILFESVNKSKNAATGITLPFAPLVLSGNFTYKNSDDIAGPDSILKNTDSEMLNYRFGGSFINDEVIAGAVFNEFRSEYGIPGGFVGAHPKGVNIEMLRRSIDAKAIFHFHSPILDNIITKFSRTYYNHIEYESNGNVGAEFVFRSINLSTELNHHNFSVFNNGTLGLYYNFRDNKMGGYVFTPDTRHNSFALALFEDLIINEHYLQFALRYEYNNLNPEYHNKLTSIGMIRNRNFHLFSADISIIKEILSGLYIGVELSRTMRAPTIEELYSEGPHLAAYSFEVGNPDLNAESGWTSEFLAFFKNKNIFASLNLFWYEMQNYILPRNTGDTNYAQLLPIYATFNLPARILGIETRFDWQILSFVSFNSSLSFTYGEQLNQKIPLARIPPLKLVNELQTRFKNHRLSIYNEIGSSQRRVDIYEEITPGYNIYSTSYQYLFEIGKTVHSINLSIENIFNIKYFNHLSRIKSIFPEPARNIKILYKILI